MEDFGIARSQLAKGHGFLKGSGASQRGYSRKIWGFPKGLSGKI